MADPFEPLLSLEDQFHAEGHALGLTDGAHAGRIEGRSFGMQKAFEKFTEIGNISGRAAVLNARQGSSTLKPLPNNAKIQRHLDKLVSLTQELPTENTEDAVADVDDRLREAKSKAILISKLIGEHTPVKNTSY